MPTEEKTEEIDEVIADYQQLAGIKPPKDFHQLAGVGGVGGVAGVKKVGGSGKI